MRSYGRASVYEFLGDFVVYRNLQPVDRRLPSLREVAPRVGLPQGCTPRKCEPTHAQVISYLLRQARVLDAPGASIERLIYVGDTQMNDGTAFGLICQAGGWPGLAFIAAEQDEPAKVELVEQQEGTLYLANRWAALADFDGFCCDRGFVIDERTAVIVDLDKTALGARGRNDHVIDQARLEAVQRTVGALLQGQFDSVVFREAYDLLNKPEFHPFTADNQDYLAYLCLILGSGHHTLEALVAAVREGRLASFEQYLAEVDVRSAKLPSELRAIHQRFREAVGRGDPTPFKTFRRNEYRSTVERMGQLSDETPPTTLLQHEILITQEVREMALCWRRRGALLFGLSDKPDEASIPAEDLAARGNQAIHRVETHAVGR